MPPLPPSTTAPRPNPALRLRSLRRRHSVEWEGVACVVFDDIDSVGDEEVDRVEGVDSDGGFNGDGDGDSGGDGDGKGGSRTKNEKKMTSTTTTTMTKMTTSMSAKKPTVSARVGSSWIRRKAVLAAAANVASASDDADVVKSRKVNGAKEEKEMRFPPEAICAYSSSSPPPSPPPNALGSVFASRSYLSWSFDALSYDEPDLEPIVLSMFKHYDLLAKYYVPPDVASSFVREVRLRHRLRLEYHNWYHAVSTMHIAFLFLSLAGADAYLTDAEIMGTLLGALVHDVDHVGNNNDFEVKAKTDRAVRYGNESVLERHSIDVAFGDILSDPAFDVLATMTEEERERVSSVAKEVIIATDPAKHKQLMVDLTALAEDAVRASSDAGADITRLDRHNPSTRLLLCRAIVHAADISNPAHTDWSVARDWCMRVMEEFDRQASNERRLGLDVTPFMSDLNDEYDVAKMQVGFFEYLCRPLFRILGTLLPEAAVLERNGLMNSRKYQEIVDFVEMKKRREEEEEEEEDERNKYQDEKVGGEYEEKDIVAGSSE